MVSATEIIGLSMERTPLKTLIKQNPSLTREKVKTLYGDIGVDIFEGKEKITILSKEDYKKSQSFISKAIRWWSGKGKLDYEEKDSVKDLVHKYAYNQTSGTFDEIEEKFGKEGRRVAAIPNLNKFLQNFLKIFYIGKYVSFFCEESIIMEI